MTIGPVEAVVVDSRHLKLERPLLKMVGQRILVHLVPSQESSEQTLRELEVAYRTMSKQERQAEIAMAEEGMQSHLAMEEAFPGEEDWPWWE